MLYIINVKGQMAVSICVGVARSSIYSNFSCNEFKGRKMVMRQMVLGCGVLLHRLPPLFLQATSKAFNFHYFFFL
jgi:hypothetical protein